MLINVEAILLILNCEKYKYKKDIQINTWLPKLPSSIKYYHVIGNDLINEPMFDDNCNILYVNSKDDYCSLPDKIIKAIKAINNKFNYKYIFKTDDDQMVINDCFYKEIQEIIHTEKDYGGYLVHNNDHFSDYNKIHPELPEKVFLNACHYCSGRFYFLSKNATDLLLKNESFISSQVIEDHAIGCVINKYIPYTNYKPISTSDYLVDMSEYFNKRVHVYTECVNCPEIAYTSLKSFVFYHPDLIVNVYLTSNDLDYLTKHTDIRAYKNCNYNIVNDAIKSAYEKNGHLGTALLWTTLIKKVKANNLKMIHFDSDVIFTGDICYDISYKLLDEYDLVGPTRCYKNNHNNRDDIRHLNDVCATYCFGLNPNKIANYNHNVLVNMVRGYYTPLGIPILDFFDPISFDIIKNGGKIWFIDSNVIGGLDASGNRLNESGKINTMFDVGEKIMHFSAIGSAINHIKHRSNVPMSYIDAGMQSYNIYNYLIFDDPLKLSDEQKMNIVLEFSKKFKEKMKDIHFNINKRLTI